MKLSMRATQTARKAESDRSQEGIVLPPAVVPPLEEAGQRWKRRIAWSCIGLLLATGCGGPADEALSAEDFPFERAAGEVLGQALTDAIPGGGMIVLLMREDPDDALWVRQEAFVAGFSETALRFLPQQVGPNLSRAGARKDEIEKRVVAQGWPAGEYFNWVQTARGAAAIVSLVEFPSGIKARDLSGLPPLFVFSSTGVESIRRLVSEGAIHTAIVPREGADEKATAPKNAPAAKIVDVRYETLTK